ncbi:Hypothetical protein R9X50_00420400 [Acrodontium crateriforme]|uniref:Peptidase A1 domain-containing protein n=1 Tax=Acrodontium crateriforme TaxID=150365 RepID=A0AAQ3M3X3_9PEZI|nr:Hypothetical protein R9X50_00420400 [Acrodontium crateriforme]
MLESLVLALLFAGSYAAMCGNGSPVSMPITDVLLNNGNTMRGVWMPVGSPPQNLSWTPSMYLNDSWIFNASDPICPTDKTSAWCTTYRGGLYDPKLSSTTHSISPDQPPVNFSIGDTQRTLGQHIWTFALDSDDVHVNDTVLSNFPLGIPGFDYNNQYHSQGAIGLGQNSTILSALKNAGHISSRSYGYWWGLNGATSNSQMDGSLVLGGYDQAKTQGSNITLPITPNSASGCESGMSFPVIDLLMAFPNGTRSSIITSHGSFSSCLQIDFPVMMSFQADPYYYTFEELAQTSNIGRATGVDWWGMLYEPQNVFQGDLQLELQGGMQLTIPNELLIVPERYIDDSGVIQANSSAVEVLINPTAASNTGDTPLIGRQFFSSVYLYVDFDDMTFTMWQANASTDSNLVSPIKNCQITTPSASPSATLVAHPSQSTNKFSVGAIAGIAIGGTAVLIGLTVVAAVLCYRRRRRKATPQAVNVVTTDEKRHHWEMDAYPANRRFEHGGMGRCEMSGEREFSGELDSKSPAYGTTRPVYEIGPGTPR